jgi:hypothetical protein
VVADEQLGRLPFADGLGFAAESTVDSRALEPEFAFLQTVAEPVVHGDAGVEVGQRFLGAASPLGHARFLDGEGSRRATAIAGTADGSTGAGRLATFAAIAELVESTIDTDWRAVARRGRWQTLAQAPSHDSRAGRAGRCGGGAVSW